ncbi:MAG: response regulator [Candidatus Dormibacteria bacterium]
MRATGKAAPIRVLLVDDNARFRSVTRTILLTSEDIEVVGEAGDGKQSIDLVRKLNPDVVLMDCEMPVMGGPEATRLIKAMAPRTRVVVLTVTSDELALREVREAGADQLLEKGVGPEEIDRAIRSATEKKEDIT